MKTVYLSIYFLVILTACKSRYRKAADEIASNAPAPIHMNAGKESYTLYIPKGWETAKRTEHGIDMYFLLAPKTENDPNTNINVITESMQNLSLEDYEEGSIASVKKYVPGAVILDKGEIHANGIKGCWYSYTMEPQGIKASLVCYIFPGNGVAYSITAGTQTKDAARYRATFDKVARSFKFDKH